MTAFLKEEITLAAVIGKSDLFGNKGRCNSFSSIPSAASVQERINSRY